MALTPEALVKKRIVYMLQKADIYYTTPATYGRGRSGVPDILACVKGRFLGIEAKTVKNKPTALQEREMSRIRDSGGVTIVVDETNLHALKALIDILKGDA